jgi:hypothetical protein
MFGFLNPQLKDPADPLVSPKSAAAWLRQLPALDVIGRQQHVMRAFEAMRQSRRPIDLNRIAAVEFLDAALGADRRQLIKQYVENAGGANRLSDRIWQAVFELSQGFTVAYQCALEQALEQVTNPRFHSMIPLLFSRLIHYYGTDAKLRVYRYERWIPAKWIELHQLYMRATELGVERTAVALAHSGSSGSSLQWTVEQEYVFVLLVHQLNTGNLSPTELDWACAQLRAWSRKLALDAVPRSPEGFFVDVAGKSGLVRRKGSDSGSMMRYLDTTPMAEQLERAIHALRQAEATDQGPAGPINQQRVAILERVRPAVSPNLHADLRRDPRIAVTVSAKVRVGLQRICRDLAMKDVAETASDAGGGAEQIEVYAVADGPRIRRVPANEHDTLAASISSFSDPMWQVRDRSVAGLRISASGGIGQSLALGGLVAVRQADVFDWVLGVVRRLNKVSNDEVEAGVSIIAERVVAVTLHAKREAKEDMGFVVDGIDLSTMGARFEGLYLPPPSRPDKPLAVKTLIVPTSEYSEGRNVILTTGRSIYTVALRHLVEQRAEWSWAAIQIIEKRAKDL